MEEVYIDNENRNIDYDYISKLYDWNLFEISFFYDSKFENTKYLRDIIMIILDVLNLPPLWKNRFILIIDELNNNAIEYGSLPENTNIMRFFYKKTSDTTFDISMEVEDSWLWKHHKTSAEMEVLRINKIQSWFDNYKSIRWRWLFMIISKLVDELYFRDSIQNWLIVWIKKSFSI